MGLSEDAKTLEDGPCWFGSTYHRTYKGVALFSLSLAILGEVRREEVRTGLGQGQGLGQRARTEG